MVLAHAIALLIPLGVVVLSVHPCRFFGGWSFLFFFFRVPSINFIVVNHYVQVSFKWKARLFSVRTETKGRGHVSVPQHEWPNKEGTHLTRSKRGNDVPPRWQVGAGMTIRKAARRVSIAGRTRGEGGVRCTLVMIMAHMEVTIWSYR